MAPRFCKYILISFLLPLSFGDAATLHGQQTVFGNSLRTDVPFSDHSFRNFKTSDGLPSEYIYDLEQTRDGYIWIATNNGIARFDGNSIWVFDRSTSNLPSNDICRLFQDSVGNLWIGTSGGVAVRGPQSNHFKVIPNLIGHRAESFYEDRHGRLLIGTNKNIFCSEDGKSFDKIGDTPSPILAMCEDELGQIWLGTENGLYFRKENGELGRFSHELFPDRGQSDGASSFTVVFCLVPDRKGGIWIGSRKGLLLLKDGQLSYADNGIKRAAVKDVLRTRNGDVIVVSAYGIYRSLDGEVFEHVLDQRYCQCLLEDSEGGLLVGRIFKLGLDYYQHGIGQTLLNDEYVHCVFEDSRNNVWLGTRDSGLFRLSLDGEKTQFGPNDGLPDWRVYSIAKGMGNEFWVATRKGIAKWDGKCFSTSGLPAQIAEMHVMNCFLDRTGSLWFSVGNGDAYRIKDGKLHAIGGLEQGNVNWFLELESGEIWIGAEHGLFTVKNDRAEQVNHPALATITSSHFKTAHEGADGSIWLGTETGVVRYKSGRFTVFGSNEGISEEFTDRLVVDSRQHLWFGGRNGLSLTPIIEFDRHSKNEVSQVACRQFESFQFTPSPFGPKTLLASDGGIWIAANSGVLRIPSNRRVNLVPPRPQIEDVKLDRKSIEDLSNVEFASGRHRLSIQFGAVSFSSPKNVRVRYKLNGYDSDWIDAKQQQRVADYTDLKPGDYQFKVTATNEDGFAAEADRVMTFTVHPRWFETVWFKLVTVLAMVGFSSLSTLVYSRSVRRRNQVLQQEIGERIAAENKLLINERRFRDLAESTSAIPFEADAEQLQFTFVGGQCINVLGYSVADCLCEDFWIQHLHPEDQIHAIEKYEKANRHGGSQQFDCRMTAADGSARWIHHVLHFISAPEHSNRVIGFMIDFTEQRNAEQKAENYLGQLERVNRAASMGEMATSIAHEVNQPLFAIVSNAATTKRMLEATNPDLDEIRDALNDIVEDGNRAATIIKNIRSHVRKEKLPMEPVDMSEVAGQALDLIGPELARRSVTMHTNLESDLPKVNGNSVELQQVILNLVLNAVQAMTNSGERNLEVNTLRTNRGVCLQVVDNGIGLDEPTADQLFEPFFTTRPQGTGMGLAINKTIIESHHGEIRALPNADRGATFEFVLPVYQEAHA